MSIDRTAVQFYATVGHPPWYHGRWACSSRWSRRPSNACIDAQLGEPVLDIFAGSTRRNILASLHITTPKKRRPVSRRMALLARPTSEAV